MRILVVAAHPDDEILGCGGTMAKFAREGHEVQALILGEGISSRHEFESAAVRAAKEALYKQSRQAAKALGVKKPIQLALPDNRFDALPLLDVIKEIQSVVEHYRPHTVFSHHSGDLNIDHTITARAVQTACRPLPDSQVESLHAFEIASSTEWAFGKSGIVFKPNLFVDITSTLERKLAALNLYEDEMRPPPHPRSTENMRATATRWGAASGVPAAEAFETIYWRRL